MLSHFLDILAILALQLTKWWQTFRMIKRPRWIWSLAVWRSSSKSTIWSRSRGPQIITASFLLNWKANLRPQRSNLSQQFSTNSSIILSPHRYKKLIRSPFGVLPGNMEYEFKTFRRRSFVKEWKVNNIALQ